MKYSINTPMVQASFRDYIKYPNGVIIDTGWKDNQPQNNQALLSMRLYAESLLGSACTVGGIQYMVFGSGMASWDVTPPTLDPASNQLENEIGRVKISASDIKYIDPSDDSDSLIPTRKIQITLYIPQGVGTGDWREFSLVGGDATDGANTGMMINWFNHDVIPKTEDIAIQRTIKIKALIPSEITIL